MRVTEQRNDPFLTLGLKRKARIAHGRRRAVTGLLLRGNLEVFFAEPRRREKIMRGAKDTCRFDNRSKQLFILRIGIETEKEIALLDIRHLWLVIHLDGKLIVRRTVTEVLNLDPRLNGTGKMFD